MKKDKESIWEISRSNIQDKIRMNNFMELYFQKPNIKILEIQERAFQAALAYEKNCRKHESKYRHPQMAKIPKGESMYEFAMRYGTTVEEMKNQWRQVEYVLSINEYTKESCKK